MTWRLSAFRTLLGLSGAHLSVLLWGPSSGVRLWLREQENAAASPIGQWSFLGDVLGSWAADPGVLEQPQRDTPRVRGSKGC